MILLLIGVYAAIWLPVIFFGFIPWVEKRFGPVTSNAKGGT